MRRFWLTRRSYFLSGRRGKPRSRVCNEGLGTCGDSCCPFSGVGAGAGKLPRPFMYFDV